MRRTQEVAMESDVLVEARVSADVKNKAERVLEEMGLTVSDAVQLMLKQTAAQGTLPFAQESDDPEYDAWFRAKVQEALDDPRPDISDREANRRIARLQKELKAKFG
jgi:DNA-damage-inducible protein J